MTFQSRVSYVFLTILIGLLLVWGALLFSRFAPVAASADPGIVASPTQLPNQPTYGESPDISLIQSITPSCVLPRSGTGACYIVWDYLYATSDPNYMITMTVTIDDRARARYQGFFQTSMYVPSKLATFRVACGIPGTGGDPNWGLSHSYVIRARDTAGLKAANYGQVFCPADIVNIYLPFLRK